LVAVFTPQGCERTIPHDPAAESGLREALEKQCFPLGNVGFLVRRLATEQKVLG
jgi:hypothetical protein